MHLGSKNMPPSTATVAVSELTLLPEACEAHGARRRVQRSLLRHCSFRSFVSESDIERSTLSPLLALGFGVETNETKPLPCRRS